MKDSGKTGESEPEWNWETALKAAILIGISINEFNEMTPYELALAIEAFNETRLAEAQEKLSLVWLGEYYHRLKKLPSLERAIKQLEAKDKKMSQEEMLSMVKKLNAEFGGEFISADKKDGDSTGT